MKKLLTLAIVLLTLLIAVPVKADPGTLYVDDDPGCGGNSPCHSTIQAAVNAANSGDTIYVAAGGYAESVTLTPGKNLTITGAGRDVVTWVCPAESYCIDGDMSGYTGSMNYEISGFTFNVRSDSSTTWGAGIGIRKASNGPLSLSIHDNRFVEDRASGDDTYWGTSMLLCHNRFAARDGSGNAAVHVYNNIDETWGGMTMSNSRAYDIYDNVFDGCSDAIYNGHGCPDTAGQTFGDHRIYGNIFRNASDDLHPGGLTPAIDWQYYGGGGGTHLPSIIEENVFEDNDTTIRFIMDTDMTYPAHVVRNNSFINNGLALRVDGDYASTLNASGNWWDTNDPDGVAAEVSGSIDYTPWLASGTDTSSDPGFQGDFSILHVDDDSLQIGTTGRIQEGINMVSSSTVLVHAGTYNERVTINKSVDLRGAQYGVDPTAAGARTNPADESIVDATGLGYANPDIAVEIASGVSGVTMDGFTLIGDPTNPLADTSVIRCGGSAGTANNVSISNNIIDGKYGVIYKGGDTLTTHCNRMVVNKLGVTVQPNPATNVTISDNVFNLGSSPVGGESATYMTSCSGCSVTGNTATGFVNGRGSGGSNLDHLTVSGNAFIGNNDAISIWGNSTFITINNNDLSSSLRYGINIKGQDVDITGNEINNNGGAGINIERHVIDTERVEIHHNNITGNTNYGVQVDTANVAEVNATCNWWDAVDGPSGSGPGSGDAVSDNVDFQPWLTQPAPSACDYDGPLTHNVAPATVPVNTDITLTATVDDSTMGSSVIVSAEYNLDGGGWTAMSANDGSFFDEVTEEVEASIPAFPETGIHEVCVRGTDAAGNVGSETCITLSVNAPPFVSADGPYEDNEGSPIPLAGLADDPDGPSLTTTWTYVPVANVDEGAICEFGDANALATTFTCTDDGTYRVTLTGADGINSPVEANADVTVHNVEPEVTIINPVDGDLFAVDTTVNLSAAFTDASTNDTHDCLISWDGGTAEPGTVSEDNGAGTCDGSHLYSAAGVYAIQVTVTDDDGGATTESVMVVVYDPEGGFVTGGGWIDSPAGAYVPDPSLTGKATFGFVSKYKKGAQTPEGQTEFVFKVADLNFHSSSYDWLVVAGARAKFKGIGTINGEGEYKFMLTALDADINESDSFEVDRFRIKIWYEDNDTEHVVYDNGLGAGEDDDNATTEIGGGSIVIHTKKK